ncbi:MAG: PilZ domain-containing protein [Candidatus Sulfotelmatobacter sp.]|jgi:hypothetical protein
MNPINTRRWPRYHVHLPVFIAANPGATKVVVPGMVCELSRAGMELYGGVNLQPGELMEVEFQTSGRVHVAGIVRNRSGFCFGLEFCAVRTEPGEAPDVLESLIVARHEAYLREVQKKIDQSLQTLLEIRKCRKEIEAFASALDGRLTPRQR